jgi:hypothetical protein
MASQIGAGLSGSITISFSPAFLPTNTPWLLTLGVASKPVNATSVDGWLPVQLPDGAQIQNFKVNGRKIGSLGNNAVALLIRQNVGGTGQANLFSADIDAAPASTSGDFVASGQQVSPNTLIDNDQFKYLVQVRIIGADANAAVQIFSIQIVCRVVPQASSQII